MAEKFQISWMNRQDSMTPWIELHIKSKKQETKACLLYYHCICNIVLWKKYFNVSWNSTVASCFLFTFLLIVLFYFWELEFFLFFCQINQVKRQHDDAIKEINQAMTVRIKASKDLKRLTEERNAAMQVWYYNISGFYYT